jgi:hypothetical protein
MGKRQLARVVLLAFLTLCGTLLGLDDGNLLPFVSSFNARFTAAALTTAYPAGLELRADAGDLRAKLRVRVRAGPATAFDAALGNGTPLVVQATGPTHDGWTLDVIGASGEGADGKFLWPAGVPIRITSRPATSLELQDWEIFPADHESDSSKKAGWRRAWQWIWLVLAAASAIGTVWAARARDDDAEEVTVISCVRGIIASIDGKAPKETRMMRAVLVQVLVRGATTEEALEATGLRGNRKKAFWFKTRKRFLDRLDALVAELERMRAKLGDVT